MMEQAKLLKEISRPRFRHWACLDCGRVVTCPNPSTYMHNLTCKCNYPEYVNMMVEVKQAKPTGKTP